MDVLFACIKGILACIAPPQAQNDVNKPFDKLEDKTPPPPTTGAWATPLQHHVAVTQPGQPIPQPALPIPQPVPQPVQAGEVPQPTSAELADITLVGQKLWDLDDNRLVNGKDYQINVGGGKKLYDTHTDAASAKLFTMVSNTVLQRPTYKLLYALRDNYNAQTGTAETDTPEEKREVGAFLDAIMATRPMLYIRKYLASKGLAPADKQEFKMMLVQMWFSFYRREEQNDSCGFEHVFLGESDKGEISGFHNWIQFWVEEAKGAVDYKGYIKPRNRGEVVDENDRVLSCQFTWHGQLKSVTTMFIGTSPEFEFALLTFYFLAGGERNNIVIDGYELCVRCYAIKSQYGDKVGSAFAELMAESDARHD